MDTTGDDDGLDLEKLETERAKVAALPVGSGEWVEAWEHYADACAWAAPALIARAHALSAANAKIAELRLDALAFLSLLAPRYAEMQGLDGLHPQHFDRLKELGARMDDFKRANIPAPLATNPA